MRSTVKRGRMTPILANTITADMGLIPGLALAGPALGLPLSVFAAFLERPFISLAGVRSDAIWYSLQANFVSLLIGYVGLIAAAVIDDALRLWGPNDPVFTVWPFVAVAISVVTERYYLVARTRTQRVRWGWIIVANVLSAAACIGLLVLVIFIRSEFPTLRRAVTPYHGALQLLAGVGSGAIFLTAFVTPKKSSSPPLAA
jgi:hypothetical protein